MQKQSGIWGAGALLILVSLVLLWIVPAVAEQNQPAAESIKNVYICGCGPACGCNMMAETPGKCACGKDLIEKQVLKEDADKVYVCACADGCKCKADPANPGKCACGKELRAYPKKPSYGCAHGMQPGGGGCDKPCCAKPQAETK
jgi:hypothetical protein